MSCWTHIVGVLYIETYTNNIFIENEVKERLKYAPQITGSEQNVDIFVNPLSGYNTSITSKFKFFTHTKNFQTVVAVTIVGDLRDRKIKQTKEEYHNFKKYIESLGYDIYYDSCSIFDEYNKVEVC